jgi:hypothetical protein
MVLENEPVKPYTSTFVQGAPLLGNYREGLYSGFESYYSIKNDGKKA